MKEKASGYYFILAAAVFSLAAAIVYLIFGIIAEVFQPVLFICLAAGMILGMVPLFYRGFWDDYIPLVMVLFYSAAIALLIMDSINDITAMFVGMGNLFGNAANVPARAAVALCTLISIITVIIGSFKKQNR